MIRVANRFDLEACKILLRAYALELDIKALLEYDEPHIDKLLTEMIAGRGFVLIDERHRGMLAAIVTRNFWNPALVELQEVCFFVFPQFRKQIVGGRLWLKFNTLAEEMLKAKRVAMVFCSRQSGLKVESYGYRPIHETVVRECQLT